MHGIPCCLKQAHLNIFLLPVFRVSLSEGFAPIAMYTSTLSMYTTHQVIMQKEMAENKHF